MTTTEEKFKLSIKETCAEICHVQSQIKAIVVRSMIAVPKLRMTQFDQ